MHVAVAIYEYSNHVFNPDGSHVKIIFYCCYWEDVCNTYLTPSSNSNIFCYSKRHSNSTLINKIDRLQENGIC